MEVINVTCMLLYSAGKINHSEHVSCVKVSIPLCAEPYLFYLPFSNRYPTQAIKMFPYLYTPRPLQLAVLPKLYEYLKAARIPLGKISLTGEAQNLPKKKTVITNDATRRGCARSRPLNCVPAKRKAPPTARPIRRLS